MGINEKLKELNIVLPKMPRPMATYIPAVKTGNLLFLSGMLPLKNNELAYIGKVGARVREEVGYEAARLATLNALAIINEELGSLDHVKRIVRLTGYVASAPGFNRQPAVINGASDILVQIFGEAGRHTRVSVGVSELPLDSPVEVELIVEVG